ncbi:MAG: hypothetical protein AB9834_22795 [Lentimicrobium sp.]
MFKTKVPIFVVAAFATTLFFISGCKNEKKMTPPENSYKIGFLHHSTGNVIWTGKPTGIKKITSIFNKYEAVPEWFDGYNKSDGKNYFITEQNFPKAKPYGWSNYPFDYYNIWVKNAGENAYMEEPTLEMLTKEYNMIIFKHCYPVGNIQESADSANPDSDIKTLQNYKLQYLALKEKLRSFPETKFLIWTAAAFVESQTTPEEAERTREFVDWVIHEWDTEGDNIFLWDFYSLETEGGQFLKPDYAVGENDSHPNGAFANKVAPLFCQRIVDVIETNGQKTGLTGEPKE